MHKLSVVIITLNEEKKIQRCLESVCNLADEIIVVDSYSTDKTKEISLKFNVKFIENKFDGYIEQKNFALKCAAYDLTLSLDADEALDDNLQNEIKKIKDGIIKLEDGFYCNRLNNYSGQWIYHCGWYPDRKIRLFNKNLGQWVGKNPHDMIKMADGSKIGYLNGNILHFSYSSVTEHVHQTNKFTTISAHAAYQAGVRSNYFKIITRPILKFIRDYIYKKGFLDGKYGLIICLINSLSAFLKYVKIKELGDGKQI